MDARQLLIDFHARGIRLIPEGDRLAVEPASLLSDADRAAIRASKVELMRLLEGNIHDAVDAAAPVEMGYGPGFHCSRCQNDPTRCGWCADHAGDPGVMACGDCDHGGRRMQRSPVSWRRDAAAPPNSRSPLIPQGVRAMIEAIEPEARRLGWPAELLWNSEFWDSPRGLASILDPDDRIVEVRVDHIVIEKFETLEQTELPGVFRKQRFWRAH